MQAWMHLVLVTPKNFATFTRWFIDVGVSSRSRSWANSSPKYGLCSFCTIFWSTSSEFNFLRVITCSTVAGNSEQAAKSPFLPGESSRSSHSPRSSSFKESKWWRISMKLLNARVTLSSITMSFWSNLDNKARSGSMAAFSWTWVVESDIPIV